MDNRRYMSWLRREEAHAGGNRIFSRPYRNAASADVLVTLTDGYWRYVDWLEDRGDICIADWVRHCEANPDEAMPLSELLVYWLWTDECNRWVLGEPTPGTTKPQGFGFWKASYGKRVWRAGCGRLGARPQN